MIIICGIALTFGNKARCYSMIEKMLHRGLPGEEYKSVTTFDNFSLGHVRLPIIDTTVKQNQPISNIHVTMIFNGEIYNYQDLVPSAKSDTDALLELITEYGHNAFSHVDGMYAVIWYDDRDGRVHIVTDPLSKKPLFMDRRTLEVASEIKALNVDTTRLNHRFLANVSRYGFNPNNETVFQDIIQIQPNSHLIMEPGSNIYNYHDNLVDMSPTTSLNLGETIIKAVQNRMVSDVPISFLLSGGLDSAIICEIASWLEPKLERLNTFYVDNDERCFSKLMADHINSNHTELELLGHEHVLSHILYMNESPVDLGSVVPQYLLCEAVKKTGCKVVITGDGADELFGGYTRMARTIGPAADTQYHDVFTELPYYHCLRLDKMSMANTIELRSPFLSKDVIRAALAVPYRDRINKKILRDIFRDDIPLEIIERPKVALRIDEMRESREQFKFKRIQQFLDMVINRGGSY